jgi:hypothetical protein
MKKTSLFINNEKIAEIEPQGDIQIEKSEKEYLLMWNPKSDITAFELAKAVPFISYAGIVVSEFFIDTTEHHFRHFDISIYNQ